MNKKQIIIIAVIIAFILVGYFGVKGVKEYIDLQTYRKQVNDITITDVDISKVADGTYSGSYEVLWVAAEVEVTIKNHKIEEIKLLKHKNGRGASAEVIPSKVVEAQSLKVDVVSGATSSSKVILKAIENALQN